MNTSPQEIIAELKGAAAKAELERMTAIEHLFSILDGDDRPAAITEARAWLKERYGESYGMVSSTSRKVYRVGHDVEWPTEL